MRKTLTLTLVVILYLFLVSTYFKAYVADLYYVNAKALVKNGKVVAAVRSANNAIINNPNEPIYYRERAKIKLLNLVDIEKSGYQKSREFILNDLKNAEELNTKNLATLFFFGAMLSVSVMMLDVPAFAESSQTTSTRLDEDTSLEKTVTVMNIPEDNTLPWGTVKGKITDPTQGHPVIIQFFKSIEEDPVHVAQVDIKGDGSFEYRFRVLSIDEGQTTHFFEGDYIVKIFKVINTPGDNLESV